MHAPCRLSPIKNHQTSAENLQIFTTWRIFSLLLASGMFFLSLEMFSDIIFHSTPTRNVKQRRLWNWNRTWQSERELSNKNKFYWLSPSSSHSRRNSHAMWHSFLASLWLELSVQMVITWFRDLQPFERRTKHITHGAAQLCSTSWLDYPVEWKIYLFIWPLSLCPTTLGRLLCKYEWNVRQFSSLLADYCIAPAFEID